MRRVARRLFTLCSALSLLLCVAVCAIWLRSYWVAETWSHMAYRDPGRLNARMRWVVSDRGVLGFEAADSDRRPDPRWGQRRAPGFHYVKPATNPPVQDGGFLGRLGFAAKHTLTQDAFARVAWRRVALPYWSIAAALAVGGLPAVLLVRRRLRPKPGHCRQCGYDLRASPERCPECGGTAPSAAVNA